jgi:dihydroneopterin aldolase
MDCLHDCLHIRGIRAYGYTGYFEAEQSLGQWFEADLTLWLDLAACGASDDLDHSVNYAEVVQRVTGLIETSRCRTIERLNTLICDAVLSLEPIQRVEATLTKLAAPIPGFGGRISVQMGRSRAS